jgi:hypothetical protein
MTPRRESPDSSARPRPTAGRSARPRGHGRRAARRSLAVPLALLLVVGAAVAYWTAGSLPGGNGAAAAAVVDAGHTPSASAEGSSITVTWPASTLSNGVAVKGYVVTRYDAATLVAQNITMACTGVVVGTTCTETDVPGGRWVYSVTPVLGAHWVGAESPLSNEVTTDVTPPVNSLSLSVLGGEAFLSADTVFYRGAAAGSFSVTNAVTDTGSGPASSSTSALGGIADGWSHDASTVSTPVGGPYASNPFSWAAGTASGPTEVVTGRDVVGNTTDATLTFAADSAAPSPGTVTYLDGYQPDQAVTVTFTTGSDARSGIATRQLERSSAPIEAGVCGSFTTFADVGAVDPQSPFTDDQVADGHCYKYRYRVTDNVGNATVAASPHVAKVDSSFGGPVTGPAGNYSVLAATGVVNTLSTTVSGDLGVSPSNAVSGFPPGVVAGETHLADSDAAQAQVAFAAAYVDAASRTPTGSFAGDQIGSTFHPGVYHTAAAFALTGTMTLDGDGDPNAIFIFQIDAAMGPAAGATISFVNGAQPSHVFWQVNGAVTVGAGASIGGTLMAHGAVTLGNGMLLIGRAWSTGTITMANATIRFTAALPPTIAISGGATHVTKDTTPTISGTTNTADGSPVTVTVDGQVLTTTVASGGVWSVDAATLTAGTWTVVASVRDASGNAGTGSQALTVEVNPDPVILGSDAGYSVLAATGVVSTGVTTVSGDLGVSPSSAVSGFPPGIVGGDVHAGDSPAAAAQTDLTTAYNELNGRTPHRAIVGDLAGQTFHAGIYHISTALALTGSVTLDAENLPGQIFIFQGDAAFNTAAGSSVDLVNGALASNVYWQIQGAVGTGASTSFAGTILAGGAVTLGDSTSLIGRALSFDSVTMANNVVRFTPAPPPTIAIDGGPTAVTKDTRPTITGTTNAPAGTTVTVHVAGQVLTGAVGAGGAWGTTTTTALAAGTYTVVASVRDVSGNGSTVSQALTVEVNPDPVSLGTAASFSALAGTSVVGNGVSTLSDDLGVSPGLSITGFPPGTVGGQIHAGDATAAQAQADANDAYTQIEHRTPHRSIPGELGGQTFHAGIYHSTTALALTGTVTLDAENLPGQIFIFQGDAAMDTAAAGRVVLVNGALASNVYWQVQGAVGMGASTVFAGTVLAGGAVTVGAGTQISGRVLSLGTITLGGNAITTAP